MQKRKNAKAWFVMRKWLGKYGFLNLCVTFTFLLHKGRLLGFYFGRWLLAFGLLSSRHAGHTHCWSC